MLKKSACLRGHLLFEKSKMGGVDSVGGVDGMHL